jgi:hypothetical protein
MNFAVCAAKRDLGLKGFAQAVPASADSGGSHFIARPLASGLCECRVRDVLEHKALQKYAAGLNHGADEGRRVFLAGEADSQAPEIT